MAENIEFFDTSSFETTHPLYSLQNHRDLRKFKSETGSLAPTEFVGLRAKMYSLHVLNSQTKIRAKGIKKILHLKHVGHQQFLNVLQTKQITKSHFRTFRSKNHTVQTIKIAKTCLNAFNDKRYILDDGIRINSLTHQNKNKGARKGINSRLTHTHKQRDGKQHGVTARLRLYVIRTRAALDSECVS